MRALPYNREKAVSYARRWALGRNPAYFNFDGLGGDCTNFVSQCLYAGAGVMNYTRDTGWYYVNLSERAPAWTGVEFLRQFLVSNRSVGPFATEADRAELRPGDVVQLGDLGGRYYHTLIVTEIAPEIRVVAHTFDALDRPLRSYDFAVARNLHILGVRNNQ